MGKGKGTRRNLPQDHKAREFGAKLGKLGMSMLGGLSLPAMMGLTRLLETVPDPVIVYHYRRGQLVAETHCKHLTLRDNSKYNGELLRELRSLRGVGNVRSLEPIVRDQASKRARVATRRSLERRG